ncbi:hypothetical protein [Arthrobacter sp. 2MCAF14]|uniref:hypothetical protein n=1 Tax=Arthrobacter sp. 2MCAF14 TaxID=3232982 RepID=UPI003F8DDD0D
MAQLGAMSRQCGAAAQALEQAKGASKPLQSAGAYQLAVALDGHIAVLRDYAAKASKAARVLNSLIEHLRVADVHQGEHIAMTNNGGMTISMPTWTTDGRAEAEGARHAAAEQIVALLPEETQQRYHNLQLYGSPSLGDFVSDLWTGLVVDPLVGIGSVVGVAGGAVFGDEQARQQVGQLWHGLTTDRLPDGSPGFYEQLLQGVYNKDLLDRDPAAGALVDVVGTIAGLKALTGLKALKNLSSLKFSTASEAIGRGFVSLRNGSVIDSYLNALKRLDPAELARRLRGIGLEPSDLLERSRVHERMAERGLGASYYRLDGGELTWKLNPLGKFGRGGIFEGAVKALLEREHGGLVELPWPHRAIDAFIDSEAPTTFASVKDDMIVSIKSIDTEAVSYQADNRFIGQIKTYVDDLKGYQGRIMPVDGESFIFRANIHRELDIVIPNSISEDHLDSLLNLVNNYNSDTFKINLIEANK